MIIHMVGQSCGQEGRLAPGWQALLMGRVMDFGSLEGTQGS